MDKIEFKNTRATLGKTQKEMSHILGTSLKAIHSYEQGWRTIPHHVERQLFFILAKINDCGKKKENCWDIIHCPDNRREKCPAWEFNCGDMCWFINGTICNGKPQDNWEEKITSCKSCRVFQRFFSTPKGETDIE